MSRLSTILLLLFHSAFSLAQVYHDSLKIELSSAISKDDSALIYAQYVQKYGEHKQLRKGLEIGLGYLKTNDKNSSSEAFCKLISNVGTAYVKLGMFDSAMYYFQQSYEIAVKNNYDESIVKLNIGIANVLGRKGKYDSAIYVLEKSLPFARKMEHKTDLAIILNNLGNRYSSLGNYSKALTYQTQSLAIYEEIKTDERRKRITLIAIGNTYNHMSDHDNAIDYYKRAIEGDGNDLLEDHFHAVVANNIGSVKVESGDHRGSINYLNKAYTIWGRDSTNCFVGYSLLALGQAYFELSIPDSSKYFTNKALSKAVKCQIPYVIAVSKYILGRMLLNEHNYASAQETLTDALEIAIESGRRDVERDVTGILYKYYHGQKKLEEAYAFLDRYHTLSDSLLNEEKIKEITRIESQSRFDQEKKELEYLHKEEILLQESELENQQRLIFASVVGGGLLLIILFLINKNRINVKNTNLALTAKNEKIQGQKKDLEQLNHVKSKLLSVLSHDLKGPLFAIQNTLLLFEKEYLNEEELKKRTQHLNIQLRDTSFFMDNLLKWAQSELRDLKPQFTDTDIHHLVQESIQLLSPISGEKGVELQNDCEPNLMAYVDTDMMKVVIRNLVSNAIKYCDNGDKVVVRTRSEKDKISIDVEDSGVGMEETVLNSIFKNTGISTQGTRKELGTGLGLSICKEFVELNRGNIEAKSELGVGSLFKIDIPFSES